VGRQSPCGRRQALSLIRGCIGQAWDGNGVFPRVGSRRFRSSAWPSGGGAVASKLGSAMLVGPGRRVGTDLVRAEVACPRPWRTALPSFLHCFYTLLAAVNYLVSSNFGYAPVIVMITTLGL